MWELSESDPQFAHLNIEALRVDQAYLNLSSSSTSNRLWLYSLSDDCIRCPYNRWRELAPNANVLLRFNAARGLQWKLFDFDVGPFAFDNETSFYHVRPTVGEFGVYNLQCNDDSCQFDEVKEAVNVNLSLLYFILIVIGTICLIYGSNFVYRKWWYRSNARIDADNATKTSAAASKPRLRCLDTFRGIAIVLMIFVNSGGGHYWWIEHATWNGLHVADLLFPWFLWIMGVCIPMSIKSQINRDITRRQILLNILIRSAKLFFIGLCLNTVWGAKLEQIRLMGVLQRFAIAYLCVAALHTLFQRERDMAAAQRFYDIRVLAKEWLCMVAIVCIHLAVIFAMPVPGCPSGYFGPGGRHDGHLAPNCTGGAVGYIDRVVLTTSHMYGGGTARSTYDSITFDPEGIFGTLMTLFQVFLGVQCGITFMIHVGWKERSVRWMLWATALGLIGGALAAFSQDDGLIPVNKNLWSLSFVLVTSSMAFALLTICYVLIDVADWWSGSPLVYAGMNAIVMYVGHEILHSMLPFRWSIGTMNTHFVLLLENAWNAMMWMWVAFYLHLKKIYISV